MFYGKFPDMYLQIDPLTIKEIEFDEIAYSKMSIQSYNEERILNSAVNYLTLAQRLYQVFTFDLSF